MLTIKVCTWIKGAPIVESEQRLWQPFSNWAENPAQLARLKGGDYVIEVWDDDVKVGYVGLLPSDRLDTVQLVDDCDSCYGDGQERGVLCSDGCCVGPTGNECPSCDGKGYELREAS